MTSAGRAVGGCAGPMDFVLFAWMRGEERSGGEGGGEKRDERNRREESRVRNEGGIGEGYTGRETWREIR